MTAVDPTRELVLILDPKTYEEFAKHVALLRLSYRTLSSTETVVRAVQEEVKRQQTETPQRPGVRSATPE
jgi:hypothetical protein